MLGVVNPLCLHNLLYLVNKLDIHYFLHLDWHFHYLLDLNYHFNRNLSLYYPLDNHFERNLDNLLNLNYLMNLNNLLDLNDLLNFHYSNHLHNPLHFHYLLNYSLNYPLHLDLHCPFNFQWHFHSLHYFNKFHDFHWDFFDPFHDDLSRPIDIYYLLDYLLHLHYPLYLNYPLYLDWHFYNGLDRHFYFHLFLDLSPYYPLCLDRHFDDDFFLYRNLYDFENNFLVHALVFILLEFLLEYWVQMMRFEVFHQHLILIFDVVMTNLHTLHFFLNPLVFRPQSRDLLLLRLDYLTNLFRFLVGLDPCDLVAILIELECEIVILVIGDAWSRSGGPYLLLDALDLSPEVG